jgi:hypothetical protein
MFTAGKFWSQSYDHYLHTTLALQLARVLYIYSKIFFFVKNTSLLVVVKDFTTLALSLLGGAPELEESASGWRYG